MVYVLKCLDPSLLYPITWAACVQHGNIPNQKGKYEIPMPRKFKTGKMAVSLNFRGGSGLRDCPFKPCDLIIEKTYTQTHKEVGIITQQVRSRARMGTRVCLYSSAVPFMD